MLSSRISGRQKSGSFVFMPIVSEYEIYEQPMTDIDSISQILA